MSAAPLTVDEWLDRLLSEPDPAALLTIGIAAIEVGIAMEHVQCLLCNQQGLTFTGAVRHLRVTETQWKADHPEDGPNASMHRPGDMRAIPFGTPVSRPAGFWSTSECRSCHASIVWAVTAKGGRMPIDAAPNPDGNVVLSAQTSATDSPLATVIRADQFESVPPDSLHTSHFQTCPNPEQHRHTRSTNR